MHTFNRILDKLMYMYYNIDSVNLIHYTCAVDIDVVARTETPVMQRVPALTAIPQVSSSAKIAAWSASQVSQWLTDHDLQR